MSVPPDFDGVVLNDRHQKRIDKCRDYSHGKRNWLVVSQLTSPSKKTSHHDMLILDVESLMCWEFANVGLTGFAGPGRKLR